MHWWQAYIRAGKMSHTPHMCMLGCTQVPSMAPRAALEEYQMPLSGSSTQVAQLRLHTLTSLSHPLPSPPPPPTTATHSHPHDAQSAPLNSPHALHSVCPPSLRHSGVLVVPQLVHALTEPSPDAAWRDGVPCLLLRRLLGRLVVVCWGTGAAAGSASRSGVLGVRELVAPWGYSSG
jgi:hypothetical protein